jgi:hypothetical protein
MEVAPPRPNESKHAHPSAKEAAERGGLPRRADDGAQKMVWIAFIALLLGLLTLAVALGLHSGSS